MRAALRNGQRGLPARAAATAAVRATDRVRARVPGQRRLPAHRPDRRGGHSAPRATSARRCGTLRAVRVRGCAACAARTRTRPRHPHGEHRRPAGSMNRIDLNADLGESFGAWRMGDDAGVMPWITSANIACGFHAGDPVTMRATIDLCARHGVAIGAHPSLPDLQGFGRREMKITPDEVHAQTLYQLGALHALARAGGTQLHHVKPHGALYNMAARDRALADAIATA